MPIKLPANLPAFDVPTLIVHGTSDQTVPIDTSARPAAAGIRQAQLLHNIGGPRLRKALER